MYIFNIKKYGTKILINNNENTIVIYNIIIFVKLIKSTKIMNENCKWKLIIKLYVDIIVNRWKLNN